VICDELSLRSPFYQISIIRTRFVQIGKGTMQPGSVSCPLLALMCLTALFMISNFISLFIESMIWIGSCS
jgi:hypothetical protein